MVLKFQKLAGPLFCLIHVVVHRLKMQVNTRDEICYQKITLRLSQLGKNHGKRKSFFKIEIVVRLFMRDLKAGKHSLTYPLLVLTPTNTSGNYSLSFFMKFDEF